MKAPRVAPFGPHPVLSRRRALYAAGSGLSSLAGLGYHQRLAKSQPSPAAALAAAPPIGTPVPPVSSKRRNSNRSMP
jgi:hypothetical protein